jgi:arabinose-5-phosphate isomerase
MNEMIMDYRRLLETEIHYLNSIPLESIEPLVEVIANRPNRLYTKIITTGMGKAGQIAHTFSTTLSSTGTPAFFLHPAESRHGDLGVISEGDILVIFSNSGKTSEVIELVDLAQNLFPGIRIFSITGDAKSILASRSDFNISYGPVEEICPLGLTPTTSTTCMSVICDLIVVGVMSKIGFTKQDYSKRHHGGYNGEKAKK